MKQTPSSGIDHCSTPSTSSERDSCMLGLEFISELSHPQISAAREMIAQINNTDERDRHLWESQKYAEYACYAVRPEARPDYTLLNKHLLGMWVNVHETYSSKNPDTEIFTDMLEARQNFAITQTSTIWNKDRVPGLLQNVQHITTDVLQKLESHDDNEYTLTRVTSLQLLAQSTHDLALTPGATSKEKKGQIDQSILLLSIASDLLSHSPVNSRVQESQDSIAREIWYFLGLYRAELKEIRTEEAA